MSVFWGAAPNSTVRVYRRFLAAFIIRAIIFLMTEAASTSETSVNFYSTTGRNIPEDNHLQEGGNNNRWRMWQIKDLFNVVLLAKYYDYEIEGNVMCDECSTGGISEKWIAAKFLSKLLKGSCHVGRLRRRWESNIKMDIKEIDWEGVDLIHVAL
jgi:hypothetical protein